MHDYPVYDDWWLQDGNDANDIKDEMCIRDRKMHSTIFPHTGARI